MPLLFVTTSGKQILLSKCGWMVVQPVKNLSYNSSDIFHRNWKLVKWKSHSVEVRCSGGIPLQFFNPDLCCCWLCDRLQIPTNCSIFSLLYTSKNNEIISHCTDSFLVEKFNLITTLKKFFFHTIFQLFWKSIESIVLQSLLTATTWYHFLTKPLCLFWKNSQRMNIIIIIC